MAKDKYAGKTPVEILFDRSGEPQPGDWEAARDAFLAPGSPWHTENPKGTPRKSK
jgi:hypothetical protein